MGQIILVALTEHDTPRQNNVLMSLCEFTYCCDEINSHRHQTTHAATSPSSDRRLWMLRSALGQWALGGLLSQPSSVQYVVSRQETTNGICQKKTKILRVYRQVEH